MLQACLQFHLHNKVPTRWLIFLPLFVVDVFYKMHRQRELFSTLSTAFTISSDTLSDANSASTVAICLLKYANFKAEYPHLQT
jgi:hypothetical protein